MEKDQTLDELEQEVIDDLNLEFTPDENPNKMFSVVFPYQVRFTIPDDQHNTEIVINTKTEEFYSGRNPQDILFQKDISDRYSKTAFIQHIQKYVRDELWRVKPDHRLALPPARFPYIAVRFGAARCKWIGSMNSGSRTHSQLGRRVTASRRATS